MSLRALFLAISLLLAGTITNAEEKINIAQLTVEISGIKHSAGGTLRIALFRRADGWPKFKNAWQIREIPASTDSLKVVFGNLVYTDSYAIEIHHDENNNGKFDMRWLPYPRPKEGVGVSNNSFGFGHPDFADARFSVDSPEKKIQIEMNY